MPLSNPGSRGSGFRIRVAPEALTIESWPLRQRPLWSIGLMALLAAVSGLVGWRSPQVAYGGIALAALLIVTWRTWLPRRFEIGATGVQERVLWRKRLIPWHAILQYEISPGGVLLMPDPVVNGLSPLRGIYIPWGQRRQELLAQLEYHLQGFRI